MLFQRERFFSSFVTLEFKKRQNRNETSLKNGIKFTGIFAFLVIKLQTPLLLKVQTRATKDDTHKKRAISYNQKTFDQLQELWEFIAKILIMVSHFKMKMIYFP